MIARFKRYLERRPSPSDAARQLAQRGHEKRRATIIETAKRIRRELNLPDHPHLT